MLKKGATCLTPLDDDSEEFCSKPAVTERTVEGLVFPLCAEHAEELDNDAGCVDSTAPAREAGRDTVLPVHCPLYPILSTPPQLRILEKIALCKILPIR